MRLEESNREKRNFPEGAGSTIAVVQDSYDSCVFGTRAEMVLGKPGELFTERLFLLRLAQRVLRRTQQFIESHDAAINSA
jgi:hypothetical protein